MIQSAVCVRGALPEHTHELPWSGDSGLTLAFRCSLPHQEPSIGHHRRITFLSRRPLLVRLKGTCCYHNKFSAVLGTKVGVDITWSPIRKRGPLPRHPPRPISRCADLDVAHVSCLTLSSAITFAGSTRHWRACDNAIYVPVKVSNDRDFVSINHRYQKRHTVTAERPLVTQTFAQ